MKFYRTLTAAGIAITMLGVLVLTFQATMYLMFREWYGFSILDILQRLTIRSYLYTNVDGFDDAVDWLLDFPLTVVLIVVGSVIGFLGFHGLREEKEWYRPE